MLPYLSNSVLAEYGDTGLKFQSSKRMGKKGLDLQASLSHIVRFCLKLRWVGKETETDRNG